MEIIMETLNTDQINDLANQPLNLAQSNATSMVNSSVFKIKPAKKNRLLFDIQRARTSSEVCRIMYYTYLAGTGLGVTDSGWQSHYRGV